MRRPLRWVWVLFKWSMVSLGVLVPIAMFVQRDEHGDEEVSFIGKTQCDFSFGLPKGDWAPDPKSATYANIPVLVRMSELANPTLFLSINRFWRDDKSPGGWSGVTEEKCQLTARDATRTKDGKEARVFLASDCDVSQSTRNGRPQSPFRGHVLYGYVVHDDRQADFIYLSSSDQALVLKNEGALLSALKSYSTSSPSCVSRRTAVNKFKVKP
jgi:hypothetical protein